MTSEALVSVIILNYKQKQYVQPCLESVLGQNYSPLEIFFVDNHSEDLEIDRLQELYPAVHFVFNEKNLFFSKAFNLAINQAKGEFIMPLNVDIKLKKDFIAEMIAGMNLDERIGMVSGKLLQMEENLSPKNPPVIDSTGIYLTPEIRHFDRGSLELDRGQYEKLEYIFGPSGAAPLYRRQMLEDIAIGGEYFDEDFTIYREDVDLAWRAQIMGWKGLYTPWAIAYHVRRIRPTDDRRAIPAELNFHSVKNRFLLRLKNLTLINTLRFFIPIFFRDILVVGYLLLREWSSLKALGVVFRIFPRIMAKRSMIMKKKKVGSGYIAKWISFHPVSSPVGEGVRDVK